MAPSMLQINRLASATLKQPYYEKYDRETKEIIRVKELKLGELHRKRVTMLRTTRLREVFASTESEEQQIRYECRVAMMQSYARIYAQQQENSP